MNRKEKNLYSHILEVYYDEFRNTLSKAFHELTSTSYENNEVLVTSMMNHLFPLKQNITKYYATKSIRNILDIFEISGEQNTLPFYKKIIIPSMLMLSILDQLTNVVNKDMHEQMTGIINLHHSELSTMNERLIYGMDIVYSAMLLMLRGVGRMKCFREDTLNTYTNYYSRNKRGVVSEESIKSDIFTTNEALNKLTHDCKNLFYRTIPTINTFLFKSFSSYKYFNPLHNKSIKRIYDKVVTMKSLDEIYTFLSSTK